MIWKFADWWDELDDWLPYAEDLIKKWASQSSEEIKFGEFEIRIASFLLMDDLLPLSAKKAFANLMLDAMFEAKEKKLSLAALHIHPPRPGRKEDRQAIFIRMSEVFELIKEGHQKQEAYELVAKKHHKSPDTIRREYERWMKKRRERKNGEIDK